MVVVVVPKNLLDTASITFSAVAFISEGIFEDLQVKRALGYP
jgi:hypothetical protein